MDLTDCNCCVKIDAPRCRDLGVQPGITDTAAIFICMRGKGHGGNHRACAIGMHCILDWENKTTKMGGKMGICENSGCVTGVYRGQVCLDCYCVRAIWRMRLDRVVEVFKNPIFIFCVASLIFIGYVLWSVS